MRFVWDSADQARCNTGAGRLLPTPTAVAIASAWNRPMHRNTQAGWWASITAPNSGGPIDRHASRPEYTTPNTLPVAFGGAAARISRSREGPATPDARPMAAITGITLQPGSTAIASSTASKAARLKDMTMMRSWWRAFAATKPPATMPAADASI